MWRRLGLIGPRGSSAVLPAILWTRRPWNHPFNGLVRGLWRDSGIWFSISLLARESDKVRSDVDQPDSYANARRRLVVHGPNDGAASNRRIAFHTGWIVDDLSTA